MASLYSLLCVATILLSSARFNSGELSVPQQKALFVFGDSLFDPGNNQYLVEEGVRPQTSSWPYGETYFHYPTGRFSDGRIVPDFIAQFMKLRLLDPYMKPGSTDRLTDGASFASGGAGVLDQDSSHGIMHLSKQLSCFKDAVNTLKKEQGETEAKRILRSAVYLFSMGGNDYFRFSQNPDTTATEQAQYVMMVIGNLTNTLKEVYRLGGRKIAFQNVGPLGCTPSNIATTADGGCVEFPLAMARQHNRALPVALKELESKLPGFKYSIFDYYHVLKDKVLNPSKYGFKEGKAACCGSGAYREVNCGGGSSGTEPFETCSKPSEYVWFDWAHTTEEANWRLAQLMWSGPPHITAPYNVKQLFESSLCDSLAIS